MKFFKPLSLVFLSILILTGCQKETELLPDQSETVTIVNSETDLINTDGEANQRATSCNCEIISISTQGSHIELCGIIDEQVSFQCAPAQIENCDYPWGGGLGKIIPYPFRQNTFTNDAWVPFTVTNNGPNAPVTIRVDCGGSTKDITFNNIGDSFGLYLDDSCNVLEPDCQG